MAATHMHIKQIRIQGFKSYRDQVDTEPFSPGFNVIVGKNGSGKSNLFKAIQFVLSDEFTNLKQTERAEFIHEGTGSKVLSAFVEIILDNSERRLPIEKDEVSIRRTIGLKKDEFRVDGKASNLREVMSFLESAGFSRANPYYIVQQGKVNSLVKATDKDRLHLLKEVAGTHLYDDRRAESLKIMADSDAQRVEIIESIKFIEERLSDLEAEKEELKTFEKLDKERRLLEYTIFERELNEARVRLERIEAERMQQMGSATNAHAEAAKAHELIKAADRDAKAVYQRIKDLVRERDEVDAEKQTLERRKTELELELKDSKDKTASDQQTKEALTKELKNLEKDITARNHELEALQPQLSAAQAESAAARARLAAVEKEAAELYSKQGRSQQFRTREERDAWIRAETEKMSTSAAQQERQITSLQAQITKSNADSASLQTRAREIQENVESRRKQMDQVNKELNETIGRRDAHNNARKDLWRKQQEIQRGVAENHQELTRLERKPLANKNTMRGLQEVRRIADQYRIQGVLGTVLELLDVDKTYAVAAEVTGGGQLLNLVVDNDDVASRILEIVNREKRECRVTFMPLNRLRPNLPATPLPTNQDVLPLISKLRFPERSRAAFEQIFGKTLVARDLDVASKYSKEHDVDAVTLGGDQVSRKGSYTGGFHDDRQSRIETMRHIRQAQVKHTEMQAELDRVRAELDRLDTSISTEISNSEKLSTKLSQLKSQLDTEQTEQADVQRRLKDLRTGHESAEKQLKSLQESVAKLRQDIEGRTRELGTELLPTLSATDKQRLSRLTEDTSRLTKEHAALDERKSDLEMQVASITSTLNENLLRRKDEITARLARINNGTNGGSSQAVKRSIELMESELKSVSKSLDEIVRKLKGIEDELEALNKKANALKEDLYKLKNRENEKQKSVSEESKNMEKLVNDKQIWQLKKDEALRKIRELGTLPSGAGQDKYREENTKGLMRRLHETHEKLKGLSHVNKKALDQYIDFSRQRDELKNRKAEVDKGNEAITELIRVLDQRKDEAIMRTFKQVSQSFVEVFKELVPHGHGSLILRKGRREEEEEGEEAEAEEGAAGRGGAAASSAAVPAIASIKGVSVRVSFTGVDEGHAMHQLSGGQKALVALAIIFAIQRSDPAPFYLFDEIDAALDPAHRNAVAQMILRLSTKAQFVVTTFKKEMVEHASQWYGVSFSNKVSQVHRISREEALDVILSESNLAGQVGAGGAASSAAAAPREEDEEEEQPEGEDGMEDASQAAGVEGEAEEEEESRSRSKRKR